VLFINISKIHFESKSQLAIHSDWEGQDCLSISQTCLSADRDTPKKESGQAILKANHNYNE
jgi:hypothetical protein